MTHCVNNDQIFGQTDLRVGHIDVGAAVKDVYGAVSQAEPVYLRHEPGYSKVWPV